MTSPPMEFEQAQSVAATITAVSSLLEKVGNDCARRDAELLAAHVLECQTTDIWRHTEWKDGQKNAYWQLVARRLTREPVAHITGEQEFWSLTFKVTNNTLIPRPDTEILVAEGLNALSSIPAPEILDIGTGSGCVLISLLSEISGAKGLGLDISNDALAVARQNAENLGVSARAEFTESDVFSGVPTDMVFDLVVSNPPYIESDAIDGLMPDVRLYEPIGALDGGMDGFDFYRTLAHEAPKHLKPGGVIAVEVGHTQAQQVARLFDEQGLCEVNLFHDLAGIERVVSAKKSI